MTITEEFYPRWGEVWLEGQEEPISTGDEQVSWQSAVRSYIFRYHFLISI